MPQRSIAGGRGTWCAVLTALLVLGGALALTPAPAHGQFPFFSRTPKARQLLQNGREAYTRAEYDKAAQFYQQAQAAGKELTPDEQTDLLSQIQQNNLALQERRNGLSQLKLAEEAMQKGKLNEAAALLRGLETNQYLAASDRNTMTKLTEQLRRGPVAATDDKRDYQTLLTEARAALRRGELDQANQLVDQAEKNNSGMMPNWLRWGDTPASLRREIQTARTKLQDAGQESSEPNKSEASGFRGIFGWMKPAPKEPSPNDKKDTPPTQIAGNREPPSNVPSSIQPGNPELPAPVASNPGPSSIPPPPPPVSTPREEVKPDNVRALAQTNATQARQLLMEAELALKAGDLPRAKQLADQAEKLQVDSRGWDRIPQVPGPEIKPLPVAVRPPLEPKPTPPVGMVPPRPALPPGLETPTEQARRLVKEGFQALHAGDYFRARQLAEQAQGLKHDMKFFEDHPGKLLAEIDRAAPQAAALPPKTPGVPTATVPPSEGNDPRVLVRQARELLDQGKLDDADRLATRAAGLRNSGWGLFEDNPNKLRDAIQQARQRREREEAQTLLLEARKLFAQGKLAESKELAWKARQKFGSPTLLDLGDRPDRLLNEITTAEVAQKLNKQAAPTPPAPPGPVVRDVAGPPRPPQQPPLTPPPPPTGQLAQVNPTPFPTTPGVVTPDPSRVQPPLGVPQVPGVGSDIGIRTGPQPPVVEADPRPVLARQKILALVAEARSLGKQDKLLEARVKAEEARQLAQDSRKLGVIFEQSDDTPDLLLFTLGAATHQRIQQMLRRAEDAAARASDPTRFQKAAAELEQAKQLAVAYNVDQGPINDKAAWLQHQQTGLAQTPGALQHVPVPPLLTGPPPGATGDLFALGKQLLEDARRELRRGQLLPARKMTEEAYDLKYGVREEATALLRTIDNEDARQHQLVANRNADAVRDAYIRGQYAQAANIAQSIDLRLLTPEKQTRLREIMSMPEMVPQMARAVPVPVGPTAGKVPGGPGHANVNMVGPQAHGPLTVVPKVPEPQAGRGFADHIKGLEEVQFGKLRHESLRVQSEANRLFKAGESARALDLLKSFQEQLARAEIDPAKVDLLRRPIEQRYQNFQMEKAATDFQNQQKGVWNDLAGGARREKLRELQLEKKQKEVAELMKQFNALYKEGKYKEGRIALLQAQEIDPENHAVTAGLQVAAIQERVMVNRDIKAAKEEWMLKGGDNHPGPYVDIQNPMAFDKGNLERLRKRGAMPNGISFSRLNPREKEIEHKLVFHRVTMNVRDRPLGAALDDLQAITGVPIHPDRFTLKENGISLDQPVTGRFEGESLKSVLNLLLKQVRLTYMVRNEVIEVTTEKEAKGKLLQVTYPVGDLVVPVNDHVASPVHDLTRAIERLQESSFNPGRPATPHLDRHAIQGGETISSAGTGAKNGQGFATSSSPNPSNGTSFSKTPVKQTIEDQLIKMITNTVAPDTWAEVGGKGTVQYYPLGLGLVVNQTLDVQEQVADLLRALRKLQDLEVAIEIRLVAVSESFFERIGLDFDVNITTANSRFTPQLLAQNFQPFGFPNRFIPDRFVSGLTPAGTFTPDLNIPIRGSSFDFSMPPFGGYPGTIGADGGISLGLAFLSDIQVFMLLEAAQGNRRVNSMQAPRITVFNGQTATLNVTTFQTFLFGVQPTFIGDLLTFIPQSTPVPVTGNVQNITPVVTADRRFVRIAITHTMTNLASTNVPLVPIQVPVPQRFFDGINNTNPPVVFQMFFQQPSFETISVSTTVTVPDGGTVLLGGMKVMSEARNEFGPPILSKIPYINRLFKNVGYGRDGSSLMMMVTPRIIISEEEEAIFMGDLLPLPR